MEHDPAGQTLKAVLQELYQRDAVNTYLRDGEIETDKKRDDKGRGTEGGILHKSHISLFYFGILRNSKRWKQEAA